MPHPSELPLADRIERLHILEPDKEIFKMTPEELRELFPHHTGINESQLIKSLIWQDYHLYLQGAFSMEKGNLRSYFYLRVMLVLGRALPPDGQPKRHYSSMLHFFSLMVVEYHLFRYRDWGFEPGPSFPRQLGVTLPGVLVLSEKIGRLHVLEQLAWGYGVAYIANRGQPSALNTEYLLHELKASGYDLDSELIVVTIVDFDPSGHEIAEQFLYQLRRLGYPGKLTRVDLVHPEFLTRSELSAAIVDVPTSKNQREKWVRWLMRTGGGLQPYGFGRSRGFSAEAMSYDKLHGAFITRLQSLIDRNLADVRREQMLRNLVDTLKKLHVTKLGWGGGTS